MITRAAILALSLALGAPAIAAPVSYSASEYVHIGDLDLALASDRQTLEARIASAARRLCRSDLRGTAELALRTECIAAATNGARAQAERAVAEADRGIRLAAR